jgi:hypothetical protein
MRICDRCKKNVDILIPIELIVGWDYAKHIWKYTKLEICSGCQTHLKTLRNNGLLRLETEVNTEFLKEVRQNIYESLR